MKNTYFKRINGGTIIAIQDIPKTGFNGMENYERIPATQELKLWSKERVISTYYIMPDGSLWLL